MSSSSQVAESWISSFCSLLGHEYFAEVSEDFIEDDFNLTGLQSQVPMYKEALEMILDVEPEEDDDEEEDEEDEDEDEEDLLGELAGDDGGGLADGGGRPTGYRRAGDRRHLRMASDLSVIETSAELLYGLIHQRYITSRPGIQQMAEKYELQHFGACPRVHCQGCKVLPVGLSDTPGQETVKLFCPACLDVYTPPNSRFQTVDGAFFGTTFGCLFFMTFPELDVAGAGLRAPRPAASSAASTAVDPLHASSATHKATANNGTTITTPTTAGDPGASSSKASRTTPTTPTFHNHHHRPQHHPPQPPQPATINGVAPHNLAPGLGPGRIYEPRIYGFRVSERSRVGPRMRWLRARPLDVTELDETRRWAEEAEAAAAAAAAAEEGEGEEEGDSSSSHDGEEEGGGARSGEDVTSLEEQEADDDEEMDVEAQAAGVVAPASVVREAAQGNVGLLEREKRKRQRGAARRRAGAGGGGNGAATAGVGVAASPMDTNGVREGG